MPPSQEHRSLKIWTADNKVIFIDEVCIIKYFTTKEAIPFSLDTNWDIKKGIYIFTTDNKAHQMSGSQKKIRELYKKLQDPWILLSTRQIVNTDNILAFTGTNNNYYMRMKGLEEDFAIGSKSAEKKLKKKFSITRLDYLTPCPLQLKIFRELGIYNLGHKELDELDATDPKAVIAFRKEWDITRWPYERLYKYFRYKTVKDLNISKLMTNIIWQKYKWIKKGIDEKHTGSIRTLWYTVEAAIDHHGAVTGNISSDVYGSSLGELIAHNLFTYKDIGFIDVRQQYRGIGKKKPAVLLMSEKAGHYFRVKGMARPYGITFACTKGQPSHLMMEYFVNELKAAKIDFENDEVFIFTISDYDAAGESIKNNMIKFLKEKAGIKKLKTHNLIELKRFDDEVVSFARTKAIRFYKDENGIPWPIDYGKSNKEETEPNNKGLIIDPETLEHLLSDKDQKKAKNKKDKTSAKFTRIYNWWNSLGDQKERLISKDYVGGRWEYTIWKVSADALPWYEVEEHYHKVIDGVVLQDSKSLKNLQK